MEKLRGKTTATWDAHGSDADQGGAGSHGVQAKMVIVRAGGIGRTIPRRRTTRNARLGTTEPHSNRCSTKS